MDDFILKITAEIVITQEDVDDIMSTALDSSMLQCWCSEVNVVGRYLGEYASDQISRGGELELYEIEEETYRSLTLENFKTGLLKYLSEDCMPVARRYCGNCFPGECVDAEYKPVYSDIKEFLKDTYGVKDGMQRTRPRIRCQDGFEMSVQAGSMLYSTPRFNLRDGEYTACEIGFPNREEELIKQYAEDPEDLTETVYAYVPVEVIDEVIKKHGGFERKEGKR